MTNGSDRKRITQSLLADPFFAEPVGARATSAPAPLRPRVEEIGDSDILDEADFDEQPGERAYADERTTVWDEPEQLDADNFEDDSFDDEGERTTIWRGGDEPLPSYAPAPRSAAVRPRHEPVPAPAPTPRRPSRPATVPVAPVPVHAPRPRPQAQVAQPMAAQTLTGSQAVVAAPARQPASVALIILSVLLAVSLVAVVALAIRVLGEGSGKPVETPVVSAGAVIGQGSLIVMSTPSGATVRINGQPHAQPTPTVVTDLPLNVAHVVNVDLAGYQSAADSVTLADANPLRREYTLAPIVGSVTITTVPAGAIVSVNGEEKGASPVTVSDLDMSRTYAITAMATGFEPGAQALRWQPGAPPAQQVVLSLAPSVAAGSGDAALAAAAAAAATAPAETVEAAAAPAPSTPQPSTRDSSSGSSSSSSSTTSSSSGSTTSRSGDGVPQPRPATERPSTRDSSSTSTSDSTSVRERPSSRTSTSSSEGDDDGEGTLSVQAIPYGQVWIDGRMVASETPLMNHELAAGPHQVKVYFVQLRQFSEERTVSIEAGASRTITFRAPREE